MKQTLLTLALTAALLPATFAQSTQTTTRSSQQSSSSTTVADPVAPGVDSSHHDSSSVTETKTKYGRTGAKVRQKKETSNSSTYNASGDPVTGTVRRSRSNSSSSSSTTTVQPPVTTTTTTTTTP